MEVNKTGNASRSLRERFRVLLAGVVVLAPLTILAVFVPSYADVVATAFVLVTVGGGARLLAGGVVALARSRSAGPPVSPLPTVSVVVTAYDEADVLGGTLAACRALAYPAEKLEILVCYESASTDGTAATAEAAARRDARVTAVARESPPAGKAAITNLGLARASGDVVAVLDADQRLRPNALRRAVAHLQAPDVACVTGRRFGTNPRASLVALYATVEHHVAERVEFPARDLAGGFTLFTGGQAFFDADVFADLGRFDETVLLEDVEMACRMQAAGLAVRVDPGIVSRERNPTTVAAWWNQRVRWARGGMQVARTTLPSLLASRDAPGRVRVDAAVTFAALLVLPLLVLAAPAVLVGAAAGGVSPLVPPAWPVALGVAAVGVPLAVTAGIVLRDRRAGLAHDRRELVAAATLPAYAAVQLLAVVRAFLDEFVLDRPTVYVTS